MQPGMPMQGPTIMFNGQPLMIIQDPMTELAYAKTCVVVQQIELLEIMTGCETKNRYHVFIQDANGYDKFLFKCKEESSCCVRTCCPSDNRSLKMKVKHVKDQSGFQNDDFATPYIEFVKPFKCTCCCLNRPEMVGRFLNKEPFGKILQPCTVCDPRFKVYNKDKVCKYVIAGSCCQCGFCCRKSTFGKLSQAHFDIYDGNATDYPEGKGIGKITRKVCGYQNLVSDADTFTMVFPSNATPEDKLMLIGAVLMMDYQYYEDSGDENNNNRRGGHHHHKKGRLIH